MSGPHQRARATGVVFIHATPTALCPHLGWAIEHALMRAGVQGAPRIDWIDQPAQPGAVRGEFTWHGRPGTGAALASALRPFDGVHYEVTEDPTVGSDGSRWSHTPSLGIHYASTNAVGDAVVHENRLRAVLDATHGDARALADGIDRLLGTAWDAELEVYRHAGEAVPVRHLHATG
ncbi:DUF3145 family protein [Kytococcus schroeteri]|uniref:DUF3145 family protein n=1 Tax=Kytococcus schroeteri TaxID=138300 RepID=UPI001143EE99|nr:DUF3145 family protein [Kytococcus schroeteri]